MADNRSTRLRQRVQDFLGDPTGEKHAFSQAVFNALARAQVRVCEEANAYETRGSLNISAGVELYDYPDGMISELEIIPGTFAPLVGSNVFQVGLVNGVPQVTIQDVDTSFVWDDAFVRTYVDPVSSLPVPSYRFIVESARTAADPFTDQSWTIVAKSLSGMTLRASAPDTIIKFRAED